MKINIPVVERHVIQPSGIEWYSLGTYQRPNSLCLRLRTPCCFLVVVDAEGRIQTVQWQSQPEPLRADFLNLFEDPNNYPFLLMRQDAEPLLVQSQSSMLAGAKGAAIKTNTGEVIWVAAEQIIGAAFRLTDEQVKDKEQTTGSEKTNDGEAK